MITHSIKPHAYVPIQQPGHRPSVWVPPSGDKDQAFEFRVPLGNGYMCTKINPHTNKIVYAQWLSSLGFRRGDYVIHKRTAEDKFVRSEFNYLRVMQLIEVQMLLGFTESGKAKCMELVSSSGSRFLTTPDEWVKVDSPENPAWHFDLPVA